MGGNNMLIEWWDKTKCYILEKESIFIDPLADMFAVIVIAGAGAGFLDYQRLLIGVTPEYTLLSCITYLVIPIIQWGIAGAHPLILFTSPLIIGLGGVLGKFY
jgi:hypothetical protein